MASRFQNARRNSGKKKRLRLEPLEDRRVLATTAGLVSLMGTELVICGTSDADSILVTQMEDRYLVSASFLTEGQFFDVSEVNSISISGGAGNDTIVANATNGNIMIDGEAGDDRLFGSNAVDMLFGGTGNDVIFAGSGNDRVLGGDGADIIYGGAGVDDLMGGAGADEIFADVGNDTVEGNDGDDRLIGGVGDDVIQGGSGLDFILGGAGEDVLLGGADADTLVGAGDADTLDGGFGQDRIMGGGSGDTILGGDGSDVIIGGDGDDELDGSGGDDEVVGGSGDDNLSGGLGDDLLLGGSGDDNASGNDGNDSLYGGLGADVLDGGAGSDTADGGNDRDIVIGGEGDEILGGGGADDVIISGTTESEGDNGTLAEVSAEWRSAQNYAERRAQVQARLRPSASDDQGGDRLSGNLGQDWFVSSGTNDEIQDQQGNETIGLEAVAGNDTYTVRIDDAITTILGQDDLLQNDTDPNGGTLTVNTTPLVAPTQGTLQLFADGTFSYQPNPNAAAMDSFVYEVTASSNGQTLQATVNITIVTDIGPVASNDSFSISEDGTLSDSVIGNDDAGSGSLVLATTPVSNVSNGQLNLNADGTFQYVPNSNFFGSDSFTYEVSNGTGEVSTAVVTIEVASVNDAPQATDDSYSVDFGGTLTATAGVDGLLVNDSDIENDSLTVTILTPPTGSVTIDPNGGFNYTPASGFSGVDTFEYRVSDGEDSATGSVSIVVGEQPQAPNSFSISNNVSNGTVVGTVTPSSTTGDIIYEFVKDGTGITDEISDVLELKADDHYFGNGDASVVLIEYSDFACPVCGIFHPFIEDLKTSFGGDVAIVTRQLPLESIHPNARAAAIASEAAANQGAFEEFKDQLFTRRIETAWDDLANPNRQFSAFAANIGLDTVQFEADLNDPDLNARVDRDLNEATRVLGLSGTPTFVINDRLVANNELTFTQESVNALVQGALDSLDTPFSIDRFTGEIRVRDASLLTNGNTTLQITANGGEVIDVSIDVA